MSGTEDRGWKLSGSGMPGSETGFKGTTGSSGIAGGSFMTGFKAPPLAPGDIPPGETTSPIPVKQNDHSSKVTGSSTSGPTDKVRPPATMTSPVSSMSGGSTAVTGGPTVMPSGSSHSTGGLIDTSTGQLIDSKTFTKTEDHERKRPKNWGTLGPQVLLEKKAYELQHKPVEKQYVVETKYVGEQAVAGRPTELVGTEAHEIEERVVEAPAGDRAVVVENVDVPVASSVHQTTTAGIPGSHTTSGTTTGF